MMICKLYKTFILLLLLCTMFVLTACHTKTGFIRGEGESENKEEGNPVGIIEPEDPQGEPDVPQGELDVPQGEPDVPQGEPDEVPPTGDFDYKLSSVVQGMAITEKGYYYIADSHMYFYDITNDISIPMCSRTNCSHSLNSCDAYANKIYYASKDRLSCICEGFEMFYYNEKLYMVEFDSEKYNYYLCRYSSSFNDKEIIAQLTDWEEQRLIIASAGGYTIYDGYFYYSTNSDVDMYGNKMTELNCMRVKLEKGATPEKIGSFDWAIDYAEIPGYGNGTTILTSGNLVYYVAGHYARGHNTKNPMQYRIAKYSVNTNEFTILDSYTGDRNDDVWGKDFGLIECVDDNVRMSEDGTIYAITDDGIVAMNFETNVKKKIYTTPYDGISPSDNYFELEYLAYDGKYLYFVETEVGEATYLTAIDTEGKLIRRYEFELTDSYESYVASNPQFGAISGEIMLMGVADGNLLVTSTSYVYKNLSGYASTQDKMTAGIYYGVGMINTSDFLENKDVEVKQIFER